MCRGSLVQRFLSSTTWKQEVRDGLRDVWAAPTREEAEERLQRLVEKARKPVPNLAEWIERTGHETLTFLGHCAPEHRRLLKTTNSMEHDHAEVRRRSRVVRIFPNEASLVRLLGALAIERNEQWMERRYMVFKPGPDTNSEHVAQVA